MADDIDLKIDETVDSFINEVAPGTEVPPGTPAKEPAAAPVAAVTSLAKPASGVADPAAPIDFPKSWKQDLSPHWAKVPRELQDYVTNTREKDYLNGLEQYKAGHTAFGELNEVITPYMPRLTAIGMRPAEAIRALLNADYALSNGSAEQRYQMLAQICQTYGLDPAQIKGGSAEQPFQTEGERKLAAQLTEQNRTIQQFLGSQFAQQRAVIDKDVATFAADPAHPHFNEVGDHIARLLTADKTLSLQDAYEQAVWANPTTRAKEMERVSKETAEKDRKAREEAAKGAAKARIANLRGKPSERGTSAAKGGWEEELPVTAAKIANRT